MRKAIYILTAITLLLGAWATAIWLLPVVGYTRQGSEERYGVSEGLQLVGHQCADGGRRYAVEDARGNTLFYIPLRNCVLDTRFRDGRLRFREQATQREGYIDTQGMVTFLDAQKADAPHVPEDKVEEIKPSAVTTPAPQQKKAASTTALPEADLRKMAQSHPFYKEASKVLQGKLSETDAARRKMILNYCEHFRTAYTTKDIDFLRQVFSDDALIIIGHVVQTKAGGADGVAMSGNATYALHTKKDYLQRIAKVFDTNKSIDVRFSDFRIMRHPTMDGIYGVSMRQKYKSDRYADDGYLFLLWDFRDRTNPTIHVRTWQPEQNIGDAGEPISLQDFNLE